MSQEKLGSAIGVTFQQVQKYENGTNRITVGALKRSARVLGVDVNFLCADASPDDGRLSGFSEPHRPYEAAPAAGQQLLTDIGKISDPRALQALSVLTSLLAAKKPTRTRKG